MTKLQAPTVQANARFGFSVSISGNRAIVGAYNEDTPKGPDVGAAYIFEETNGVWSYSATLLASDGRSGDDFGVSVSIDGNRAIVGANQADPKGFYSGAAYIFEEVGSSWIQIKKLVASDGDPNDYFGSSVSISGNYAIVGAPNEDTVANDAGAVYFFKFDAGAWSEQSIVYGKGTKQDDIFGNSVSISGDRAIVGAPRVDSGTVPNVGAAYILERDNNDKWGQMSQTHTVIQGPPTPNDFFGWSVSISGNYAIIGANVNVPRGYSNSNPGQVYIYEGTVQSNGNTIWNLKAVHAGSPIVAIDHYGQSVAISSDHAIVGANLDNTAFSNGGAAYLYKH